MSFSPLNAHAEFACEGAPVSFVLLSVPGGPFTSPANARPPTSTLTNAATASRFISLSPLLLDQGKTIPLPIRQRKCPKLRHRTPLPGAFRPWVLAADRRRRGSRGDECQASPSRRPSTRRRSRIGRRAARG